MLSLKEKDRPIIRKLLAAGCCARCVLRFCCVGTSSSYKQSYEVTVHLQITYKCFISSVFCIIVHFLFQDIHKELLTFVGEDNSQQSHDASGQTEDPPNKRMKMEDVSTDDSVTPAEPKTDSDICPVCLGVLQDFCDGTFVKQVCNNKILFEHFISSA